MSSITLPEQWRTNPPAVVRLYYQMALDGLGMCYNQIITGRSDQEAQQNIAACLRTYDAIVEQTGILTFMQDHVIPSTPITAGRRIINCWHQLAIELAMRFSQRCDTESFGDSVSELTRFLFGDDPPAAPITEMLSGVIVQVRAEQRRALEVFPRLLAMAERNARSQVRHSHDFRMVNWFGTTYHFTPTQAACIRVLWRDWHNGTPELGENTILEDPEVEAEAKRLIDVFRDRKSSSGYHAAWGTMVLPGQTKGSFRLSPPCNRDVQR